MKINSEIPDKIIREVKKYTGSKNLPEALIIALDEWISLKRIQQLNTEIEKKPLEFSKGFSSKRIRNINRIR